MCAEHFTGHLDTCCERRRRQKFYSLILESKFKWPGHISPQLKHATTAMRYLTVPQNSLVGFAKISQINLTGNGCEPVRWFGISQPTGQLRRWRTVGTWKSLFINKYTRNPWPRVNPRCTEVPPLRTISHGLTLHHFCLNLLFIFGESWTLRPGGTVCWMLICPLTLS